MMSNIQQFIDKRRGFVHESGHAIIAVLQNDLDVRGIGFCEAEGKYVTIVDSLPDSNSFYLCKTGGMAAENLIYGKYDPVSAAHDIAVFNNPGAPPLDRTVEEAAIMVTNYRPQIGYLEGVLMSRDLDKGGLRIEIIKGDPATGEPDRHIIIMTERVELEEIVKDWEKLSGGLLT
jgi:hypothetical protein